MSSELFYYADLSVGVDACTPRTVPFSSPFSVMNFERSERSWTDVGSFRPHEDDPQCNSQCRTFDLSKVKVGSKLGKGASSTVYLCNVPRNNDGNNTSVDHVLALKVMSMSSSLDDAFRRETAALQLLDTLPSVVRMHGSNNRTFLAQYTHVPVRIIFLDAHVKGELYNTIERLVRLPEPVARTYIRDLWRTVASIHAAGVSHRDIKLENLLVRDDWGLVLSDFGSALTGHQTSSNEYCGSEIYMAPEIRQYRAYDPRAVDVWSCGVTVFTILFGVPPFFGATADCWYFRCARDGRWDSFWKQHEKDRAGLQALSAGSKRFLERALVANPALRPTAEAMCADEWLSGEVCDNLPAFMEANLLPAA
jgi:serine/threonine protein kinase